MYEEEREKRQHSVYMYDTCISSVQDGLSYMHITHTYLTHITHDHTCISHTHISHAYHTR